MTADQKRLREHVRRAAATSLREADSYIDTRGRFFSPAALPEGLPQLMRDFKHPNADCYSRSKLLAESDPSIDYAEGWALAPDGQPYVHAWCVDSEDHVIDTEWPTPETLTYFGVIVPRLYGYGWRRTLSPLEALAIEERDQSR